VRSPISAALRNRLLRSILSKYSRNVGKEHSAELERLLTRGRLAVGAEPIMPSRGSAPGPDRDSPPTSVAAL
jgi:hypothetical protein